MDLQLQTVAQRAAPPPGVARTGTARPAKAWLGMDGIGWASGGSAMLGQARRGTVRQGMGLRATTGATE